MRGRDLALGRGVFERAAEAANAFEHSSPYLGDSSEASLPSRNRRSRLGVPSSSARTYAARASSSRSSRRKELAARGVQVVVVVELEPVDDREPGARAVGLGDRDRPVQLDDR